MTESKIIKPMKKATVFFSFSIILIGIYSFYVLPKHTINGNEKVLDVLVKLGDKKPLHYKNFNDLDELKIKQGYELFTTGVTLDKEGNKVKKQSKHFVCTDCHNMQIVSQI